MLLKTQEKNKQLVRLLENAADKSKQLVADLNFEHIRKFSEEKNPYVAESSTNQINDEEIECANCSRKYASNGQVPLFIVC